MTPVPFEPTIVGFLCNWCTFTAADLAGTSRQAYPPNLRIVRVMCSGRVDPTPLTTHEFDFDDIETAFRMMDTKEDGILKPLIRFP